MRNWIPIEREKKYREFCQLAVDDDNVFKNFKNDNFYKGIVGYMDKATADEYMEILQKKYPEFLYFKSHKNDEYGNDHLFDYEGRKISGVTLMYLKITAELYHKVDFDFWNILEIGGGYGGQCLTLYDFGIFRNYYMVDVPEAIELQRKYLGLHEIEFETTVPKSIDLVIANFSWSELSLELKHKYIEKYFKKARCGYVSTNCPDETGIDLIKEAMKDKEIIIDERIPGSRGRPGKIIMWR